MLKNKMVVAGFEHSDRDRHLMKAAASLSEAMHLSVRFVHSVESKYDNPVFPVFGKEVNKILQQIKADSLKKVEEELESLVNECGDHTSLCIKQDRAATSLMEESDAQGAWLTMVGARPGSHAFTPASLSTTRALINQSERPVMVVNDEATLDLSGEEVRILCADDLMDGGEAAIQFAAEFAQGLGESARLQVLHVNPMTEESLEASFQHAILATHSQVTPAIDSGEVFRAVSAMTQTVLEQRIKQVDLDEKQLQGCVVHGQVVPSLLEAVESFKPHVVIFGKHLRVHRRPFYFGHVPLTTAYRLNIPFVVVPKSS